MAEEDATVTVHGCSHDGMNLVDEWRTPPRNCRNRPLPRIRRMTTLLAPSGAPTAPRPWVAGGRRIGDTPLSGSSARGGPPRPVIISKASQAPPPGMARQLSLLEVTSR